MDSVLFSVSSVLDKTIRLTTWIWHSIVTKHTMMQSKEELVRRAIIDADFVRRSRKDPAVYLYYLVYNEYCLCT